MQTLAPAEASAPEESPRVRHSHRGVPPTGGLRRTKTDAADLAGKIATFVVVVGSTLFVFFQVQPKLIFGPNMDVGGPVGFGA